MTGMVQDKVILVTGGSTGIGRATARILAREGATVVIADVQDEEGARTVEGIVADGGRAEYRHVDVSDYEAVRGPWWAALPSVMAASTARSTMPASRGRRPRSWNCRWPSGSVSSPST